MRAPATILGLLTCGLTATAVVAFPPFVNWPSSERPSDCRGFFEGDEYRIGLASPMQSTGLVPRQRWDINVPIEYEDAVVAWQVTGNGLSRELTLQHVQTPDAPPRMPPYTQFPGLEKGNVVWNGTPMTLEVLEGYCVYGSTEVLSAGWVLTGSDYDIGQVRVLTHSYPTGEALPFRARVTALWGEGSGSQATPPEYLGILLSSWGSCAADSEAGARSDLNGDGTVGPADLGLLLSAWSS